MTTPPIQTLTDEQLNDVQEYCDMTRHVHSGDQACISLYELRCLLDEIRTLRSENAELLGDFAYQRTNDEAIEQYQTAIESTGVRTR